jgi:hypothetical protein
MGDVVWRSTASGPTFGGEPHCSEHTARNCETVRVKCERANVEGA